MARAEATPPRTVIGARAEREPTQPAPGYAAATWARLRSDRLTMIALALFITIVATTLLAPWVASTLFGFDPYRVQLPQKHLPPSIAHPMGTDELGRDVLARTLIAGRVSLAIGLMISVVSMAIGVPVGLASGFYGGRLDDLTNAVIQTFMNIPTLFLLILLAVTLPPDPPVPKPILLAVIIGALGWMGTARFVRGAVLSVRERDYVLAARAMGASDARIMAQHVLPNVISMVTVIAGFDVAGGILAESGLSYLGLGVQPPVASWGNMLAGSLENVSRAPWLVVFPGAAILLTVLSIFLLADGLRDALDPRLKG